jgi:hypothetical protein
MPTDEAEDMHRMAVIDLTYALSPDKRSAKPTSALNALRNNCFEIIVGSPS